MRERLREFALSLHPRRPVDRVRTLRGRTPPAARARQAGDFRLLGSVHHRLRFLTIPMRTNDSVPTGHAMARPKTSQDPSDRADAEVKEVKDAAQVLGFQLTVMTGASERDIEAVFGRFGQNRPDALFVHTDPFFQIVSDQFVALAARHAIPAIYPNRELVKAGGLISYGARQTDAYHQAGIYTGKSLKGCEA